MLKLGMAQANPVVGDIQYNLDLMRKHIADAREQGVQLLIFPELMVSGYPPEDLLLRRGFLADCQSAIDELAREVTDMVVLTGFPQLIGRNPYNSLAVLSDGKVQATYQKMHLPNYGVFDENRYFAKGSGPAVIEVGGITCGLTICEDIWYSDQPLSDEALAGAELILNLSASPYHKAKGDVRENMLSQRARDHVAVIAYCNMVGGQDELVFDGQSLVIDHRGRLLTRGKQFESQLLVTELDFGAVRGARLHDIRGRDQAPDVAVPVVARLALPASSVPQPAATTIEPALDSIAEVYGALVLGVHDYITKNGFGHVVLGMSGGIDSALVALIASDALGPENVTCVVMPSEYSSSETQGDARSMARGMGCDTREIAIKPAMDAYEAALAGEFVGCKEDVTEENIQARIRGNLLMALSNKFGWLVLSTGNKSEVSCGYFTIYGDGAGGLAVIRDVPKTLVFELTRWRNEQSGNTLVPMGIIERPPSAELKPGQQDSDSLPPYDILDPILARYIEEDESIEDIVAAGYERSVVERVVKLVNLSEYKRRQAPPGIKVTGRAFGRDRRMPLTNGYRGLPSTPSIVEARSIAQDDTHPQEDKASTVK